MVNTRFRHLKIGLVADSGGAATVLPTISLVMLYGHWMQLGVRP